MALFFVGVLQKLRGNAFGVNTGSHEIMAPVAEYTNDLGCERFVQKFDYGFAIRVITRCDSTILDVLSGAFAQSFDISEKWLISHELTPLQYEFRGTGILTQIRSVSIRGGKLATYFHLCWRALIARHLDRHLPHERFDPASAGIVFTTIKQRD